jgi:hypothetical protein
MLRVTYEFFCDICGELDAREQVNIGTGGVIPTAMKQPVFNNVALCDACATLAVPAMNEALKGRFATETTGG